MSNESFFRYMREQENKADSTALLYFNNVKSILARSVATSTSLDEVRARLELEGLSPSTVRQYCAAWKAWLRFRCPEQVELSDKARRNWELFVLGQTVSKTAAQKVLAHAHALDFPSLTSLELWDLRWMRLPLKRQIQPHWPLAWRLWLDFAKPSRSFDPWEPHWDDEALRHIGLVVRGMGLEPLELRSSWEAFWRQHQRVPGETLASLAFLEAWGGGCPWVLPIRAGSHMRPSPALAVEAVRQATERRWDLEAAFGERPEGLEGGHLDPDDISDDELDGLPPTV